jgi:uncharacterized DUF497 family protein
VAIEVHALSWDDENEAHMAKHGVTPREVNQMVENPHLLVRNRKHKRARLLMIGRTHGGRALCVPLAKTPEDHVWRPVTAFAASEAQTKLLDRKT